MNPVRKYTIVVFPLIIIYSLLIGCEEKGPPFSSEKALDTIEVPKGFRIELVAAEPLVKDPVDMAFDANGRLYVVEMPDYPSKGNESPISKVVLLEDQNGDGEYDNRTIFAKDLPYVNGVMPWKDGILVTNAPDILYFEDTTGDGQADLKQVVLRGFAVTNPQLRVSNLRYGIDNWIYGTYFRAFGSGGDPQFADQGEPLYFPDSPKDTTADIQPGMDFRFRPDDFLVERAGGRSQFGNAFDAAGNRFTVMNSDHIRHVVIPYEYTTKNPFLSVSSVMESISDHENAARVYPITENMINFRRSENEVGRITAACGTSIYTGDIFPKKFNNVAFTCDPARNIVHADLLSINGATFTASRVLNEKEFVASTDSWFRPVNSKIGPDGALYIVDMYRYLVEHQAFIPHSGSKTEEGKYETQEGIITDSDFYKGQNLGRIYRIVPEEYESNEYSRPNLKNASTEELLNHLDNPNMWWRITSQRLLIERADRSVISALKRKALKSSSAEGRMHALWTLQGLRELDDQTVIESLDDKNPVVKKQAILLTERRLSNPEVRNKLVKMTSESNDHVQFQLALTLGKLSNRQSFEPLQQLAKLHIDDSWFQTAIALSISDNSLSWFKAVSEFKTPDKEDAQGKEGFLYKISSIIGARQLPSEISDLLSLIEQREGEDRYQIASLDGLEEGIQQGVGQLKLSQRGQNDLMKLIRGKEPKVKNAALNLAEHISISNSPVVQEAVNQAMNIVLNEDEETDARVYATRLLGLNPDGLPIQMFEQLLTPKQPVDLQMAAARVLVNDADSSSIRLLIDRWDTYTSEIRKIVENGFLGRQELTLQLMEAINEGELQPSWLSRESRSVLTQNTDEEIREMAKTAFGDLSDAQREKVVSKYYKATTMNGNLTRGKEIYEQRCSQCHQLEGVGYNVGPDLLSFSGRTKIEILRAIINPNSDITPGYEGYVVRTTDGQSYTGVMAHESSDQVVLRNVGGGEQTISRDNIESVRPMSISLMPNGLEADMSIQEMADLIEYLKSMD